MGKSKKSLKTEKVLKEFMFALKVRDKVAKEFGEEVAIRKCGEFREKFLKRIKVTGMITISLVSDIEFVERLMTMGYGGGVRVRVNNQLKNEEKDTIFDCVTERGISIKADPKP